MTNDNEVILDIEELAALMVADSAIEPIDGQPWCGHVKLACGDMEWVSTKTFVVDQDAARRLRAQLDEFIVRSEQLALKERLDYMGFVLAAMVEHEQANGKIDREANPDHWTVKASEMLGTQ